MASLWKRKQDRRRRDTKWMICWYDAELGKWRDKAGYTDKKATLELGQRLEKESARRAEGVTDPIDEHRRRPISGHVDDFVARVEGCDRSSSYVFQLRSRIERIMEGVNAKRLQDLDPVPVERFLTGLRFNGRPLSGVTRNEYIGSLKSFTRWALEARRIEADPLASLKRAERKAIKPTHPRRAFTAEEVARWLDAAERRPLLELLTVRHGPNKGKPVAELRPEIVEKAKRLGRQRRLAYLLAVWTGLRRSEIKALTWGDVDLDNIMPPRIRLRAETTKSKRADTLVIHPQLADELRAMRPVDATPDTPVVTTVPSMKVLRADLALAGLDYGSRAIGYADLHAQRKTLSTMMAAGGMSQRVRQAHMRHTDPRLTENTYMDEALLPIASELAKLPAIPHPDEADPEVIPMRATGTDDVVLRAGNAQEKCPTSGQELARHGKDTRADDQPNDAFGGEAQVLVATRDGNSRHGPTPVGIEPFSIAGDGT